MRIESSVIATTDRHPNWVLILLAVFSFNSALGVSAIKAQDCVSNMLQLQQQGDGVAINSSSSLQLSGGFTLECWASSSSTLTNAAFIEKGTIGGTASYALGIDSAARPYVRLRSLSGEHSLVGTAVVLPRNWHHYAATFSPGDSIYLYLDGVEVASVRFSDTQLRTAQDSLRIGVSVRTTATSFVGAIDEVRIWSRARTLQEIRSAMNNVLSLPQANLTAYYPFDDDPALTTIHDFASNKNDGVFTGASPSIATSTSPVLGILPGFKMGSIENYMECHTIECSPTFDTVVHFFNHSDGAITLGSIGFANGLAFSVTGPGNIQIPRDSTGSQAVRIHFSPQHGGSYYDTLTALSSSICGGIIRVPVHANYRTIELTMDQRVLGFGVVAKCNQPLRKTVKLSNLGNEDAHLTSATTVPGSDVDLISPLLPFKLGAGQDTTLVLQLRAGPDGPISTTVTLTGSECGQSASVVVAADRASIGVSIPPNVVLPPRQATLTNVIADTLISILNTGTIPFFLAPTNVVGAGYSLLHAPTKTYLKPGDTAVATIRFQTTTCGAFDGSILVHINNPCTFDTAVPLHIHVGPPVVVAETDHYFLGNTCTSLDTVLRFYNTGDEPVLVKGIGLSVQNLFSIPNGAFPDTIGAHSSITVPIHFEAGHAGRYTTNAQLQLIPCGNTSFQITASAGLQGLTVSDTLLGFGRGCDFSNVTRTFVLSNHRPNDITIATDKIIGSPNFTIANLQVPFVLRAQSSLSIDVIYRPNQLGKRDDALLTLESDSGCLINTVHLEGSRELPNVRFSAKTASFDTVCTGDTILKSIKLLNLGIDTIDITSSTLSGSTSFSMQLAPKQIAADDSGTVTIAFIPTVIGTARGNLSLGVGPCANPVALTMIGSGGPTPSLVVLPSALNFGTLQAGDSTTLCIRLTNPSCNAIQFDPASITLPRGVSIGSGYAPVSLSRGDTITLCLTYKPHTWDTLATSEILKASSGTTAILALQGIGLATDLQVVDTVLDFGYVLQGSLKQLPLVISNRGNEVANATISTPIDPTFTLLTTNATIPPIASQSQLVGFLPTTIGRRSDTITVSASGFLQRVILRGEGVSFGLTQSLLEVDFGDVHVGSTSIAPVHFMATNGFPITVSKPNDKLPFSFSIAAGSIDPIKTDKDTFTLAITFSPTTESPFLDTITIGNTSHPTSIVLRGRGVEAHPVVLPDSIGFGKVQLGSSLAQQLRVIDTGGFAMTVTAITSDNPNFSVNAFAQTEQLPLETRSFTAIFSPSSVKPVEAHLTVHTTAPDSLKLVTVTGRGSYGPTSGPDVSLSIADAEARVGDHLTIPISLKIANLASVQLDSIRLDLSFDPYAVYLSGASSAGTLSAGVPLSIKKTSDSTAEILLRKPGIFYSSGVLLLLNAEALLGPHDTSQIAITSSNPENALSPLAAEGQFVVKDCNGQSGNVTVHSATAAIHITPNPTSEVAHISYTLDHPTHVKLQCFDPLGKLVKVFLDELEIAGDHSATLRFDGIASGRYLYELHLDSDVTRGALVIAH